MSAIFVLLLCLKQMRASPRISPITVTTTSRYESSTRNIAGSPRNFSSSPSPKRDTHSPSGNYITSSTHRMSSPVTVMTHHRLSSPITTTAPRLSSPSFNNSKVNFSRVIGVGLLVLIIIVI